MYTWFDLNLNEKNNLKHLLKDWLLKQRMSQIGYDRADYVLMRKHAAKLRKYIKYHGINPNTHFEGYKMLIVKDDKFALAFEKSFNLDLLKLMELFTRHSEL